MRVQHVIICGFIAVMAGLALAREKPPAEARQQPIGKAKEAKAAGFTDLLAGGDLTKHFQTAGNWTLSEDGVAHLSPRPGETGWKRYDAYLWLKGAYKDFECEFEYKHDKGGNSGFYFNVADRKKPAGAACIEVQIIDSAGKKGPLRAHDCSGGILAGGATPKVNAARPAGQWNHLHVRSIGGVVAAKLNGALVSQVDLSDPQLKGRPKQGAIGFQDHGQPLWLRKIRIRRLRAEEEPSLKIRPRREGDRVDIVKDGDKPSAGLVLAVRSQRGIGGAAIERESKEWPKAITVRLYLRGLESLHVTSGARRLDMSVLSHSGHRQLLHLRKDGREGPQLKESSPYWTKVDVFDAEGKPIQGLPKGGGYFQVTLPKALFDDNPKSIRLDWIDFYR